MTDIQELLGALRQAEKAVAGSVDPKAGPKGEEQQAALARLKACMDAGMPALSRTQAAALAEVLRRLMASNSTTLKWTRMRARLARIGVPRAAHPAPRAPRLDLVS